MHYELLTGDCCNTNDDVKQANMDKMKENKKRQNDMVLEGEDERYKWKRLSS